MPRIIFINRFFFPDLSATSQMLSDLAFALGDDGLDVAVITSRSGYEPTGVPLPSRETVGRVLVRRVRTSRFGRHSLPGRVVDYVTFYLSALVVLLLTARRGDIIVAKTDPPVMSVLAGPIARLRGAVLVNWLQDIFPEVAEVLDIGGGGARAAYGMIRRLRNASLKRAACNVVLGERMAVRVRELGVPATRIRVIANWADGAIVRPSPPQANALRRQWGLTGKFVVGYSGNLGRAHEIGTLVEAIAALEQEQSEPGTPDIVWLFVGGGVNHAALMHEVDRRRLASVQVRPYQPRRRLGESLSAADVHLVSLRPALEGLIVPSKIYGVMAAGRPTIFIGDPDGEVARLIAAHDCGVTVAEGDGRRLAAVIRELALSSGACRRLGVNARAAFDAHYEKAHAVARWRRLLEDLAPPHRADPGLPSSKPAP